MEEDEVPLGTFPETQEDIQEDPEQAAEADRCLGITADDRLIDEAWSTVPPAPVDWIPPAGELWVPPEGATTIRRLTGYTTARYVADAPEPWGARNLEDYRVLTMDEPSERSCSITIDGYVKQEKYDELVKDFNNLKAKVDRLESFLSTVSTPDDEMMTI